MLPYSTTFSPNSTGGVEKDAEGPEQKVNEQLLPPELAITRAL